MTKILVTGATGTIGKQVVHALLAKGLEVRAAARSPEKLADLAAKGAETVSLDYAQPDTLSEAFTGVDRVFLLTPFVEDDRPLVQAGVEAAKAAGASFILRMSAAGADPDSEAALARHHGENEEKVRQSGLGFAVIQPNFFQDNYVNFNGPSIKAQGAFYGAAGEGTASYVSSVDVGASAAAILAAPDEHLGQTYLLTGPEAVSESEGAALVSELTGREVQYMDLSPDDFAAGLRSQGAPEWQIAAFQYLESVKANNWAAEISPAVEEITGRAPESLRTFLERHRSAFV